jgi:glycosyltransferase involved in cell wall biosynthesis
MKIGVDIRVLMDEHYSGISEYTANLITAILRQNGVLSGSAADKPDDYRLFYNSFHDLRARLAPWAGNNKSQLIGTRWPNKLFNYFLQKFCSWPKLDQVLGGVDIFWSPHFNFTSLSSGSKAPLKISTVHDLSFLRYPEFFSARKNFWHRALDVKKILRAADKIVAVSENTKNDVIELVGIAAEKIQVIYPGNNIKKEEISAVADEKLKEKYRLSDNFILYVGNIEPRKNILGLIEAFNALRTTSASKPEDRFKNLQLVLAGGTGWKNKKIYHAWQKSLYKNDIKFLGYINENEKAVLYSQATVFAYPSFYEGFGFPPLEAMTYGLPVVCSNVSSLPEVVGNAALTINPFKSEEIADALEKMLTDDNLRADFIARGYERIKLFSWDKTAVEYLKLFKN